MKMLWAQSSKTFLGKYLLAAQIKIVIVGPGQQHVKAQVWSFENVREKQK